MTCTRTVFQFCRVVPDAWQANTHWARLLQRPSAPIELLCPSGILHHDLSDIGVGLPHHVGDWSGGSCASVDAARRLGVELSIDHGADMTARMPGLPTGAALALAELKAP